MCDIDKRLIDYYLAGQEVRSETTIAIIFKDKEGTPLFEVIGPNTIDTVNEAFRKCNEYYKNNPRQFVKTIEVKGINQENRRDDQCFFRAALKEKSHF